MARFGERSPQAIIAAKTAVRPYAEASNRAWHCVAAPGHTLTDALDPGYLSTR